jgi:oligopeptidase A
VKPAIEENLQTLKSEFESLERRVKSGEAKGYSAVIEELEKIQAPLSYSWGVVGHLMGVKNSDDLREAHQGMQAAVVKQNQALGQSVPLFRSLEEMKNDNKVWEALDEAQQRIVDASLLDMKKSGVGLSGKEKELFNDFKLELSELSTKFSNNLLDATKAYQLVLTDKKDVEGLPQSTLSLLASKAVSEGHKEVMLHETDM